MKNRNAIIFILITLLSIHCGNNLAGNNGGGATETTNGIVYSSLKKPVAGAIVRLIDSENWLQKRKESKPVVVDSVITDSSGRFYFTKDTISRCNLQIDNGSESILIEDYNFDKNLGKIDTIALKKNASIKGLIKDNLDLISSVDISGTTYSSEVSDSAFTIPGMAPGEFEVYIKKNNNNLQLVDTILLSEGEQKKFDINNLVSILVDNFDSSDFYDSCNTFLGKKTGGIWFLTNKQFQINNNDFHCQAIKSKSYGGYHLELGTQIPKVVPLSQGIGFTLAKDSSFDLSKSFNLSFSANGHGNLRVVFYSRHIDSAAVCDSIHFGVTISLDTQNGFDYVIIECDSLDLEWNSSDQSSNYDLKTALKQIYRIDFIFSSRNNNPGDYVSFKIDDIYILNY